MKPLATDRRDARATFARAVGCSAVVVAGVVVAVLRRFVQDDAFISFRYAKNLSDGLGLVWNVGERVEGYTNFLWTLMMAPAFKIGVDIVVWSWALSIACFAAVLLMISTWRGAAAFARFAAAGLVVANYSLSSYATGGLETQLVTASVVASAWLLAAARPTLAAVASAMAMMTRMDAVLLLIPFWLSSISPPLSSLPLMPVRGLCAHRGDAAAFPENTVPAIEAAARKGAAMVEIDIKRCKTGELVLMHDDTVDRTTTGTGKVSSLTFDEIRALDAGVKKDAKFAGTKVPTFDEAIDCLPNEGIWINVHCKGVVTVKEVVRKLKEKGRLHQAFIAGREKIIRAARKVESGIGASLFMTNPDGRGNPWTNDGIRAYVEYAECEKSNYLQLRDALIDAPAYREFRAHGGKVIYCFGNDEKSIKRVAALGFEFALTDNLDAMLPHFPTPFEGRP